MKFLLQIRWLAVSCALLTALVAGGCSGGSDGGGAATPVSVNTLDGGTGIAIDGTFAYDFAQAVNAATVDADSFFLLPRPAAAAQTIKADFDPAICDPAQGLPALVSCEWVNRCTLDPEGNLVPGQMYVICLSTGIQYMDGTAFEGFMATFTTAGGGTPAAPDGVSATPGAGGNELLISWNEVADSTSYNLYWGAAAGVTPATGTKIENVTSPYAHAGLTTGTPYYYVVAAATASGEGPASVEFSGVPQIDPVGALDATLGGTGFLISAPNEESYGDSVAIDDQGRIIAAGSINVPLLGYSVAVWRFLADGTPDASFGGGDGLVTVFGTATPGKEEWGNAMTIDAEGRIVVAGQSVLSPTVDRLALWRFNADGSQDTSFGTNGVTVLGGGATEYSFANDVELDTSGRILATGRIGDTATYGRMALLRYDANGTLDATFGAGGIVLSNDAAGGGSTEGGDGIAVAEDGSIVVVGQSQGADTKQHFALWRFTSAGTPDTTFASDGSYADPGTEVSYGFDVAIDGQGRIVTCGGAYAGPDFSVAIQRFTSAGALDTAFSGDGVLHYSSGPDSDSSVSLAVDARGRIYALGNAAYDGTDSDMLLLRATDSGDLDATFDADGVVLFHNDTPPASEDVAFQLAFDATGRLVLTGTTGSAGNSRMALWRYQ